LTDFTTSGNGIPDKMPKPKAVISNARNGCSFSLVVASTMKTMENTNKTSSHIFFVSQ